ncbi:hypothetical protein [Streptomyces sp. NPDC050759]|uniref:hypothetical protein n=1 Tax=Streptomyces sp. NPDC050759 TaxID=3365635 RepID=UPI0037B416AC
MPLPDSAKRRRHAVHPTHAEPELPATRPDEIRSRDATRLRGPVKRVLYHLYSIIDIYSRYTVVWMVAVRADVMTAVYQRDLERFVNKPPAPPIVPASVWINQPDDHAAQ